MLRLQGFKGDFFSIGKKFKGKFKAGFFFLSQENLKYFGMLNCRIFIPQGEKNDSYF